MAVPNIQDITQKLALMSDPQMQQYAKMNQDDPYVLSLAVSEKNRRAAMRMQAPQQVGQPSVADSEIGEMAAPPPQMQPQMPMQQPMGGAGLSALPAPNMEDLDTVQAAGGGILGFQQGGMYEIPGMIGADSRIKGLLKGREESDAEEEMRLLPAFWEALKTGRTVKQVREGDTPAVTAKRAEAAKAPKEEEAPSSVPSSATPSNGLLGLAAKMGRGIDTISERVGSEGDPPPAPRAAPQASSAAPEAVRREAAPAQQEAQRSAQQAGSAHDRLREAMSGASNSRDELLQQEGELNDKDLSVARDQLMAFDQRSQNAPKTGAEREERLRQREAGLFSEEGHAMGNAAMRAMLAILGGTSRSSRVNIARGLAVGLNSFDKRMDQVEARRQDIHKNLDQLEQLREQAAGASAEKRERLEDRMEQVRSQGARSMQNLTKALGYEFENTIGLEGFKMAEKERATLQQQAFDASEKQKDRANSRGNAMISASSRGAEKGPKDINLDKEYADYIIWHKKQKADPLQLTPPAPPESKAEFARSLGLLPTVSGGNSPPPGMIRPE